MAALHGNSLSEIIITTQFTRCLLLSTADQCVVMLAQDSFYRCLTMEEKADIKSKINPSSFLENGTPNFPLKFSILP